MKVKRRAIEYFILEDFVLSSDGFKSMLPFLVSVVLKYISPAIKLYESIKVCTNIWLFDTVICIFLSLEIIIPYSRSKDFNKLFLI